MVLEGGLLRRPMREGPSVEPTVSWAYRRGKGGQQVCVGELGGCSGLPDAAGLLATVAGTGRAMSY